MAKFNIITQFLKDFSFESPNVPELFFKRDNGQAKLEINIDIQIKGADGKTESNTLQITINEKDTSRRVYVTPYGEKYHYSAACAGKNARATTENSAIRSGLSRCKKCG